MKNQASPYTPASAKQIRLLDQITITGKQYATTELPESLDLHPEIGVAVGKGLLARSIHFGEFICHPRSCITPGGDYLLMHAAGPMHYAWAGHGKVGNQVYQYRSTDQGETWSSPSLAWEAPHSFHAAVPFIPTGSSTIYAFGTEPSIDCHDGSENAMIGYRTSNDDGHTWSDAKIIRPENDPDFRGMSAMRLCETSSGAWLLGSHSSAWKQNDDGKEYVVTEQYVLRSADQGETWRVLPGPRPGGWQCPGTQRMDEGRPILLPGGQVLFMARTPEGHLWQSRSDDDGLTWSPFECTSLRHLDAPPMLFMLGDGETLVAFFHNKKRAEGAASHLFAHEARVELWCALSRDGSRTWSEPRLLAVNACEPAVMTGWGGVTPMVSYADLLVNGDQLDIFIDHQMRQVIQVRLSMADLLTLPTREDLL